MRAGGPSGKVHVFVGPSLTAGRVRAILPGAEVHPPIQHGDVLRLPLQQGDVVAVIDGMFHWSAAVRHKELLYLVDQGVAVAGSSSMGALRAVELAAFGMHGVGVVYRLFAGGLLDGDDEVAVVHATAEDSYRPLSEALVTIRVVLRRAMRRGILTPGQERALLDTARRTSFHDRRLTSIATATVENGPPRERVDQLLDFAAGAAIDVKRDDAERLLRAIAAGRIRPRTMPEPLAMTTWIHGWLESARRITVDGVEVSDLDVLTACQLFAADYRTFHYRVLLQALVRGEAAEAPSSADDLQDLERCALVAARRRGLIRHDVDRVPANLARWLRPEEVGAPLESAVAHALVRTFRLVPGILATQVLLDALSGQPGVEHARRLVVRADVLNATLVAREERFVPDRISESRLRRMAGMLWGTDELTIELMDRGFRSEPDLFRRARKFAPLAVLTPEGPFSLCTGLDANHGAPEHPASAVVTRPCPPNRS